MPGSRPEEDRSARRLYRRGHVYWTWWYDRAGHRHRQSTKCTSERAAKIAAGRIEEEAQRRAGVGSDQPFTVTMALDELLDNPPWASVRTLWSHESRAVQIARHLGDVDVALLEREDLAAFIEAREREVSAHETHKELVLLRLALRAAREAEHWSGDLELLFPKHRADYKPRERWLQREEALALMRAFSFEHHRLWLAVALYTGARFSEVNDLVWTDVDLVRRFIRIRGTKTEQADRVIPLTAELLPFLRRARPPGTREPTGPVVRRWTHAGRDIKAACKRAQKALQTAQLERGEPATALFSPVTPNDLRRTTASWMAQKGVPLKAIADWLGHKSLDMVMKVYARVNPEGLRVAAAALPRLGVGRGKSKKSECDNSVPGLSTSGRSKIVKKATPPRSPQRAASSSEWARLESNQRPLASEAKAKVLVLPLRRAAGRGRL